MSAALLAHCEGPQGPMGPAGQVGTPGPQGDPGSAPCAAAGLKAKIGISSPRQGSYFSAGEAPVLTIHLLDGCNQLAAVSGLATANLYLNGPRQPLRNKTASKLLNAVTDRSAKDRQHHYINLRAPSYKDPAQANLGQDADGTLHYRLAPISDEEPGTYTTGVWAVSSDQMEQVFALMDLQIGTAQVEAYSSGPSDASTCVACHLGPESGKLYINHVYPGFSPLGNYALDIAPIGTCRSCHNQDGYSQNPVLRKIHAAHRGAHQVTPGVAHPDYGLPADQTLAEFKNVVFPSLPDGEKDCAKCHKDDRWLTAPSRQGCGTCHETVFFDSGTLDPPRALGKSCTADADCASLGQLPTCNTMAGMCEIRVHPKQTDDAQCATCHSADSSGLVPIAKSHEILSRTRVRNLQITGPELSGGSGMGGTVQANDTLTLRFHLRDGNGNVVGDLKSNPNLSGTLIIGGPTDDRQLSYQPLSIKGQGTLSFDGSAYTYVVPSGFPAQSQPPLNAPGAMGRPNPPGTYSAWIYVTEALTIAGQQVRNTGSALLDFRFGDETLPVRPREVITRAACDSCHVNLQAHGGTRTDAQGCSLCHAAGAMDRTVGAVGASCKTSSDCRSWEACQANACVITQDPTPNRSIRFASLVHSIHYARKLEGYAERNDLLSPGSLIYIGFRNGVSDFSDALLPVDVRNCSKCHADSGAACSAAAPCGVGQDCVSGSCRNVATQTASAAVCLSCHDSDTATGHAAIMTWKDDAGNPVETCDVCHAPDAAFAVAKVHNISMPYRPPYSRDRESR